MSHKSIPLIIGLILVAISRMVGQELQFYREEIVFTIDSASARTDATYYFCNVGDKALQTSLLYPFPENTMNQIDSLLITETGSIAAIPFRQAESGVFFPISLSPYGHSAYRVFYRQRLTEGHFRYILTSTSAWGRPLESACYELRMPLSLSVDSLSYRQDTTYILSDLRIYQWKRKVFLPDRDFEVFFH